MEDFVKSVRDEKFSDQPPFVGRGLLVANLPNGTDNDRSPPPMKRGVVVMLAIGLHPSARQDRKIVT